MNYLTITLWCTLLVFFASCGSTSKTSNYENNDTTAKNEETSSSKQDTTTKDPNATGYTGPDKNDHFTADAVLLPANLQKYMQANMQDWSLITRKKWLTAEFKKLFDPGDTLLVYEKQIVAKGDFNGDGKEDCAAFMMNKANEAQLMVFHQTDNGYDVVKLEEAYKIEGETCLGSGISLQPAGKLVTYDPSEGLELKNAAIFFDLYGKSSRVLYYKDGKYAEIFVGD